MKNEALKASEDKSTLLRHITHELRTPMNSILGFSKMLIKSDNTNFESLKHSEIIYENSKRLLTLINDILDLSKLDTKHIQTTFTRFKPNQFKRTIMDLNPLKNHESINLEFLVDESLDYYVTSNEKMIKQILINLVGNALKFTNLGHIITRVQVYEDNYILFSVEDSGIGIPLKEQEFVFDEFYQIGGETQEKKGSGLGLNISKKLVEYLNGDIWFDSELGKGTTFYFTVKDHTKKKIIDPRETNKEVQLDHNVIDILKQLRDIQFFRKSDLNDLVSKIRELDTKDNYSFLINQLIFNIENHEQSNFYNSIDDLLK